MGIRTSGGKTTVTVDITLNKCQKWLREKIIEEAVDPDEQVSARPLLPREAIGEGDAIRHDYPLRKGREFLLEATFRGEKGQAFTERPTPWTGTTGTLDKIDLEPNGNRAIFVASINAIGKALGLVRNTVHCRNDSLNSCAGKIGNRLAENLNPGERVLIIGYQPAFIEAAAKTLGPERVKVVDLDIENIGRTVFGVHISDGKTDLEKIFGKVHFALVTGSSLVNGTYSGLEETLHASKIPFVLFGTSAALPAAILEIERWCLESK